MIFVIAPELGSASPIMTHVFESAACCEYAFWSFVCLCLSSLAAPLMMRPCFVLPSSNLDGEMYYPFHCSCGTFLSSPSVLMTPFAPSV